MTEPAVLLHLATPGEWRAYLSHGAIAPVSLADVGFVHLSTHEQVALPADRLFHDRRDLLLLAVDGASVEAAGIAIRWEPGVPGDPASMRFPHAYGPVPTSAVVAVQTFRPRRDGGFDAPPAPPARADHAARLQAYADSMPRRIATTEVPVTGGVAVLQADVPWSHACNQLLVDDMTAAQDIRAEADRVLGGAGRSHRCATLRGPDPGPVARELGRSGWWVQHEVVMVRRLGSGPGPGPQAGPATLAEVRRVWTDAWRTDLPVDDPQRLRLPDRYPVDDQGVDVRYLAVRDPEGTVVAAAACAIDGATAVLDAVETATDQRGKGYGDALLRGAIAVAEAAGCDLLALDALAEDWPRHWYSRRGFTVVDESWAAGRQG
ncbi:MAG: GNAT family N-acetyltransferase [Pseudonocardia sp.]|nr:GNAT family N-acetyltransferase [Pseudonocardia sp.]